MAYNGFAIDTYLDAEAVNKELDALIQKPVYTIRREKLKDYVQNYFEQKCSQSKAMIAQAKKVIPGGVQQRNSSSRVCARKICGVSASIILAKRARSDAVENMPAFPTRCGRAPCAVSSDGRESSSRSRRSSSESLSSATAPWVVTRCG